MRHTLPCMSSHTVPASPQPASVPVAHGTPQSTLDDVVVIPFNDVERSLEILNRYKDELACVLLDLVPHRIGLMAANREFVQSIREWTRANARA